VELEIAERAAPAFEIATPAGLEEAGQSLREMLAGLLPRRGRRRRLAVAAARETLCEEEAQRLVDPDLARELAIRRVEQAGIVFLDEIDKIARRDGHGLDVSREGVQRDLLPIVEGSTVSTRHGSVRTDHVLFIAAGAFHVSKPSDLIPELQGRFPIRVELESLGEADFVRILVEPHNALVRQYRALLATEGIELEIEPDAVREIARIAAEVNARTENIGARRLHTVLERLLDPVLFDAPDRADKVVRFDAATVRERLGPLAADRDLSRYIL
jgi:ATP-dependent HslUV protease ATP-binding subunit HslU